MKKYPIPAPGPLWTLAIVALLILLPMLSLCQDISRNTITWEAIDVTDLQTVSTTPIACQFITINNSTMEWVQRKETLRALYSIASVEGSWDNISTPGSITYLLQRNGKYCKMTVEHTATGTFIIMDFSKENEYTSRMKFRIKSFR